ncbi:catalase, partial [Listeria monocytogenes]|nr:catalase [Listeria monocytogenes]
QRDGHMPFKQQTSSINYEPNSYDTEPKENPAFIEPEQEIRGDVAGRLIAEKPNNFGHAKEVWDRYSDAERAALVKNIVDDWSAVREDIKIRNLRNFYQVDPEFASRVAAGTGVNLEEHVADLK